MFNKKTLPVAAVALIVLAALLIGASQVIGQQQPAGQVITAQGAFTDNDQPAALPAAPALPAAVGQVTFNDAFDNKGLTGWSSLPDNPGTWSTVDGRLEQWGDVDRQPSEDVAVLIAGKSSLDNGVFDAQFYSTSGEDLGVVFRGSDQGYYRLTVRPNLPDNTAKAYLYLVTATETRRVAESSTWKGFAVNSWQHIQVNTAGSRLVISIDGNQLFDVQDSSRASGWVGVWSVADRGARFDNVRVQSTAAGR